MEILQDSLNCVRCEVVVLERYTVKACGGVKV